MRATDGLETTITCGPVNLIDQQLTLDLSLELSLALPRQDEHLPDQIEAAFASDGKGDPSIDVPEQPQSLALHEREYIEYVLTSSGGNISEAARRLGLHRQSLQRKLRKYPPRR